MEGPRKKAWMERAEKRKAWIDRQETESRKKRRITADDDSSEESNIELPDQKEESLYDLSDDGEIKKSAKLWVLYNECMMDGRLYHCFLRSDPNFGEFARYAYPNDGSWAINLKTFTQTPDMELTNENCGSKTMWYHYVQLRKGKANMKTHIAVALLWGAPNDTGIHIPPGSNPWVQGLVVDHIGEGNSYNWRLDNLHFVTMVQNK